MCKSKCSVPVFPANVQKQVSYSCVSSQCATAGVLKIPAFLAKVQKQVFWNFLCFQPMCSRKCSENSCVSSQCTKSSVLTILVFPANVQKQVFYSCVSSQCAKASVLFLCFQPKCKSKCSIPVFAADVYMLNFHTVTESQPVNSSMECCLSISLKTQPKKKRIIWLSLSSFL